MAVRDNVKVHFAGYDNDRRALSVLKAAGVNYRLFTCYPFIKNTPSSKNMFNGKLIENRVPFRHTILDSGLFTLMFGAKSGAENSEDTIREWMHRIVRFAKDNNINASFVECDCQKIISPEFAWKMRMEMRELMPGREIINVFHMEDGESGFRRIVDFSDYIAISVPELRIAQPKSYRSTVCALARMARRQKPNIKIHLLGCTEERLLRANSFCTSADSSSWTASVRFGTLNKRHISGISDDAADFAWEQIENAACSLGFEMPTRTTKSENYNAANYYTAANCLANYTKWCGNQD